MSEHVTVEHGHHLRIDAHGWIAQRVGGEHTELTAALGDWGRLERDTGYPSRDWITRAELWCAAREYVICEGFPVLHDHPRLSNEVSVLLAHAGDLGPVAIVSIDGHPPTVYADVTTDDGSWHQIGSIDIVCPHGHRWTWSDTELVTPAGQHASVAAVFGDQPHAPFTPCPDCLAYDNDETDTVCQFPGADIIACPVCGQRCDLELTAVATVPQRRAYAVHVSEAVEYQGWVLAVDADDADDADDEARRLLADGGTATGRGNLELVRLDREIMANDAAQLCWQCRTDARQPNPACPHPPPGHGRPVEAAQAAAAHTAPVMSVDTAAVEAWLRAPSSQHPGSTNADALGIDEEYFGRGEDGFLSTVDDLLYAWPPGLTRRSDIRDVLLWLIPDGDVLDQGAVITVDLANGVRLATLHQDIKDFADRAARGTAAAMSALAHIATQASMVVDTYQRTNAGQAPPG